MRAPARWPLATVFALAERRELRARVELGEALAAVARRRGEEDAAREALRLHRAAAGDATSVAPVSAGTLTAEALRRARRAEEEALQVAELRRREVEHGAARDEAERRRVALGEARAAVRALEARRQVWREARARDRACAEEEAVDEIVSARWGGAS